MTIQTPGICTNIQGCDTAKRGKAVWIPLNDNFKCPTCRAQLKAPEVPSAPRRIVAVAVVLGGFVLVGGGAVFSGSLLPHHGTSHGLVAARIQSQ
jgi:hypothetical protein